MSVPQVGGVSDTKQSHVCCLSLYSLLVGLFKYPFIHPSIYPSPSADPTSGHSGSSLFTNTFQLLMGYLEALPGKPRYVIPPASPGPTLGPFMIDPPLFHTSTGRRPEGSLIWCLNWFLSMPTSSTSLLSCSSYLQPLCRGTSFWPLVSMSLSFLATTSSSRP